MTTEEQTEGVAYRQYAIEEYHPHVEPYYVPIGDEVELFEAAFESQDPGAAQGPDRLRQDALRRVHGVEARAAADHRQGHRRRRQGRRRRTTQALPLITVACHEDLTASDLVGRYLLEGEETRWIDGPLTRAVKAGAICYLDEVVEARKDTTVLIHPLTDHRRVLPIEKRGQIVEAADGFLLVISYNPGYQSALKDLKHSTRQRFISIEFTHPPQGAGGEDHRARERRRRGDRAGPREARREGAQPARARPERRREHASARLRRQADRAGHPRRAAPARSPSSGRSPTTLDVQRSIEEVASSIFE